jgi:hypothetical protein
MKRSLFSIAGMMGLVLLIAVGFAALRSPTILWASLIFTATVAFLATSILGVISRRGRARMTWAGIAVFGWIYVALSFGPVTNGNGVTCPPFPTQALIDYLRNVHESTRTTLLAQNPAWGIERIQHPPEGETILNRPTNAIWLQRTGGFPPAPAAIPFIDWMDLRRIGHSLGAIVFGLLGGLIGRVLAPRDEPAGGGTTA